MSAYFQKGCKGIGCCVIKIRGNGLARLQHRTLLRASSHAKLRRYMHPQQPIAIRSTVALCINRTTGFNDVNPDMPQLRQFALASAHSGNYDGAITTFNQLLETCPNSAVDYNNRGLVHFQAGHLELAIADYNQALELNPCLDSAYNNRANYYAAKGNFLEAILDYNVALELNPDNIRAWINQGITFRDLRMYERAIANFNLALTFKQLEGHIYAERGRTHHLSGDWNWAISDYERACQFLVQEPQQPSQKRLRRQVERWINELLCNLEI